MCSVEQKPMFEDLNVEEADPEVTEIESLCMNCYSNVRKHCTLEIYSQFSLVHLLVTILIVSGQRGTLY